MLAVIETWLNEIVQYADTLLSGEVGVLNSDQIKMVEAIRNVAAHTMPDLLPLLSELLHSYPSPPEAVKKISTEWRTPITTMLGYSRVLLDGLVGIPEDRQTSILENIYKRAENLSKWSSSG